MSILLQKKNVGDYSYMSSPNIYYRAAFAILQKYSMSHNYRDFYHFKNSYFYILKEAKGF